MVEKICLDSGPDIAPLSQSQGDKITVIWKSALTAENDLLTSFRELRWTALTN
jgi:hypothetical protein